MRRSTVIVLAISLLLALSSCGQEDAKLLPGETAREITANLDTVKSLVAEGDCTGAESAAEQIRAQVEGLSGVDPELKQALAQGASRLDEVVATCTPPEEETVESNPEVLEDTTSKEEEKSREEEEKQAEKEQKQEEREEEKAAEEEEKSEPTEEPSLPPQANGEAKGHEKGPGPGSEGESGGISPGSSAEGEGG